MRRGSALVVLVVVGAFGSGIVLGRWVIPTSNAAPSPPQSVDQLLPASGTPGEGSANWTTPSPKVAFSPGSGCTGLVVLAIDHAQRTIRVQAYTLNLDEIGAALLRAIARKVQVQVVLDEDMYRPKDSKGDELAKAGAIVKLDGAHRRMHDKVIVVDERFVVTGSFNFSKDGEQDNAENVLLIESERLAKSYLKDWEEHASHSHPLPVPAGK